nr:phasin family protein [uncultured Undibacterium sp.]
MIFVANQLFSTHPQTIEQQFAACSGLSQSISEEFDRSAELQAQTVQLACESWAQFYSTLWQVKDPQEFFMLFSAQLHANAEQTQHYWHATHALTRQIQEKMFALEQTLSPMIKEGIIDITPAPNSTEVNITPRLVDMLPTKAATKTATKAATKATTKPSEIAKKAATATLVRAKTVPVKRSAKQAADTNIATVVASKTKAKTSAKPEAKSLQSAAVIASIEPATPAPVAKLKRVRTPTKLTQAVEVDTKTEADTMIPTKPPSKVRQVKKTETTEAAATTATSSIKEDSTTKKSAVVGLPTKLASKPGFPGVAGQPGYKAKSSKATGAKKRVRQ